MSEYRRNKGMVACIIAVIAGGALTVGALTYFGSTGWSWFPGWNTAKTVFPFEHEVGNTTGTVTLDVNLGAGGVVIRFEENTTLLYRMTVEVQNSTLETHGAPVVVLASNVIGLNYTAAGVNLTLGTGVNYTIDVTTSAGAVSITLDHGAHIGNMSMTTTAGAISVIMGDIVQILGDSMFDLETSAGAISVNLDLPVGVGGSFEASTTVGPVTVTQVGWNQITTRHYETDNYDTAETTLTIVAQAATGAISANLSWGFGCRGRAYYSPSVISLDWKQYDELYLSEVTTARVHVWSVWVGHLLLIPTRRSTFLTCIWESQVQSQS